MTTPTVRAKLLLDTSAMNKLGQNAGFGSGGQNSENGKNVKGIRASLDRIGGFVGKISGYVKLGLGLLIIALLPIVLAIKGILTGAMEIWKLLKPIFEAIKTAVENFVSKPQKVVFDAVKFAVGGIADAAKAFVSGVVDGVIGAAKYFIGLGKSIIDGMLSWLSSIKDKFVSFGWDIGKGLINWIITSKIGQFGIQIANDLWNWLFKQDWFQFGIKIFEGILSKLWNITPPSVKQTLVGVGKKAVDFLTPNSEKNKGESTNVVNDDNLEESNKLVEYFSSNIEKSKNGVVQFNQSRADTILIEEKNIANMEKEDELLPMHTDLLKGEASAYDESAKALERKADAAAKYNSRLLDTIKILDRIGKKGYASPTFLARLYSQIQSQATEAVSAY